MTNWRELCAELLQAVDDLPWQYDWKGEPVGPLAEIDEGPFERARALLAQPEPEAAGPSDEDIIQAAEEAGFAYESCGCLFNSYIDGHCIRKDVLSFARALLQRYATPQPSPVPVADLAQALQRIARHGPIMGSTGDYRQGQLDILENVQRIATEALNALPVPGAEVG
jgi:hypothetical protein